MPQKFYLIFCILFILLPYASTTTAAAEITTTATLAAEITTTIAPEKDALQKATEETVDPAATIINIIIATFVISFIFSIATCVMLWYTFFYIYANIYRMTWSLEEKLRVATRRLSDRKLGDDIMAKMREMAPYDASQNHQEISTMLKSVYQSQGRRPAGP